MSYGFSEFTNGVLDYCSECDGVPVMKPYGIKDNKDNLFVVECTSCDQLVGPCDGFGLAMAAWNKEQRSHGTKNP